MFLPLGKISLKQHFSLKKQKQYNLENITNPKFVQERMKNQEEEGIERNIWMKNKREKKDKIEGKNIEKKERKKVKKRKKERKKEKKKRVERRISKKK